MNQRLVFAAAIIIGFLLAYSFGGDFVRYIRLRNM